MRPFTHSWAWNLASTPEQLWPFFADTNRFNRDIGLPAVQDTAESTGEGGVGRRLTMRTFGMAMEWEEVPFEWMKPNVIGVLRTFTKGPFVDISLVAHLEEQNGGTVLKAVFSGHTRYAWIQALMPLYIKTFFSKKIEATVQRYDRLAQSGSNMVVPAARVEFAPGGQARLSAGRAELAKRELDPAMIDALCRIIETSDDLTISRLRPYALADLWHVPRRTVLELCLHATRVGMLEFQWEFLCPLCRGAQQKVSSLSDATNQLHCGTCNIDFELNFDRSVELTFRPNPAIRQSLGTMYCIGGPNVTPHIMVQQRLLPGETKNVSPMLEEGRYRLRMFREGGSQFIVVKKDGAKNFSVVAGQSFSDDEIALSTNPTLSLGNKTDHEQVFVLERLSWTDQAATAADITALQTFRDLFSAEALRSGEQISVGTLTITFTDLKGSTKMYQEIGDAPAFGLVLDHFDVIKAAIAEHDGAIVKNIGDAIMAVFRRPANSIKAMLKAQAILANPPAPMRPLTLRSGMHAGPCIAVNLNNRLDYFGTAVNKAARLEGKSLGTDVVVSEDVYNDPEVQEMVAPNGGYTATSFDDELKGFEGKARLYRISLKK